MIATRRRRRKIGRPLGARDGHGRAVRVAPGQVARLARVIAKRVHDLRVERDISVTELAAGAGYHAATVHRFEAGRVNLPTTIALALALGVSPREVMP